GGSFVQVSSQRSEAEAQAAFRGLQAKFPNQLGGRQPVIHKVDLGAKGTYYRAMVGPFASSNEAVELCTSLKAAGGQCLIQRN
ncbi:MAG TPA: SPOR domain-containing protein, partial [Pseudolabrys sp.]|nr:SPOR domain-containing protein [Pseudolabrys sp.]